MANIKFYRINKNSILDIKTINNFYVELAFKLGYVFIKQKDKNDVYMISTNQKQTKFDIKLVNCEIVDWFTIQIKLLKSEGEKINENRTGNNN